MSTSPILPSPSLQHTFERISNLLRAEEWKLGGEYNLQPIQLQMLRYLSICNRYSNTPAAVTEYFGLTKGTVSQSLKLLEAKSLVQKVRDAQDGRSVHLQVTEEGARMLAKLQQLFLLPSAGTRLDEVAQAAINAALLSLLRAMQQVGHVKSFGVCASCQHHRYEGEGRFRCGLTDETLLAEEIGQICREHQEKS